jgi:hypothetical protein
LLHRGAHFVHRSRDVVVAFGVRNSTGTFDARGLVELTDAAAVKATAASTPAVAAAKRQPPPMQ